MRILPVAIASSLMFCGNTAVGRRRPLEMADNPRTLFNNCEGNVLPWVNVENFDNGGECPPLDHIMLCEKNGRLVINQDILERCNVSNLDDISEQSAVCLLVDAIDIIKKTSDTVDFLKTNAPRNPVSTAFNKCFETMRGFYRVIVNKAFPGCSNCSPNKEL